jgi:hypothetical protein
MSTREFNDVVHNNPRQFRDFTQGGWNVHFVIKAEKDEEGETLYKGFRRNDDTPVVGSDSPDETTAIRVTRAILYDESRNGVK